MAQQRKRIDLAADGTSYEYRCHENVDLDDLDPQVLRALAPVTAGSVNADAFWNVVPEQRRGPDPPPEQPDVALLRLYGFTFVADAMGSLELRLWIFSSPPRVERLEYRWYADMGFSRCEFEMRDSPSGIEIVVPAESVLPFQSVPAQSQIEFRITISKLNSNSIDFSVYENVHWYPDRVELFLLQDVPIAPDESWEVAADLLDEHGYAERAQSLRQFVARNRSGRSV